MNIKSSFILLFLAVSALVSLASVQSSNNLEVIFFDVGQGDASLIILPGGIKILVDGGPDDKVLEQLGKYLNFFDRKIDYIVLSHEHDDHSFGLIQIIKRYEVKNLIHSVSECEGDVCLELFKVIEAAGVSCEQVNSLKQILFDENCIVDVYPPLDLSEKNVNDRSIAIKLNCLGNTVFMDGDGETKREDDLLRSGKDLSSTIFKASHHGSKTSNGEEFLKAISPLLVVISSGFNNKFKHPSDIILSRLDSLKIQYFRTDKNGNIHIKFIDKTYPQVTLDKE